MTWLIMANIAVVGLAIVSYVSIASVQLLYPYDGMVTADRTPSFEWSGWQNDYELMIDDDESFGTPLTLEVSGNSHALSKELEFGTYWWKVTGEDMTTVAKRFTVVSMVALSRPERTIVMNAGNTDLLVYPGGLTGALVLGVNEEVEVGEDANVKAEQK
jgi:hypothetical protein